MASGVENLKGRMGEKETKRRREGCIIWIPSSGEPAPLSGGFGVGFGYTISNLQLAISKWHKAQGQQNWTLNVKTKLLNCTSNLEPRATRTVYRSVITML